MMDSEDAKAYAAFLSHVGYCRISNSYNIVSRVDTEDWLPVLADNLLGNYDRAYMVGPDHYRRMYSRDQLIINDSSLYFMLPPSNERMIAHRDLTKKNQLKIQNMIRRKIVSRR